MPANQPSRSTLNRGYPIAFASAAILSTTAIFIRHLTLAYRLPALVLAFWRDVFVVISLLFILGLVRPRLLKIERQHLLYLMAYGLALAFFNSLWTLSVAINGAAVATVLVYCSAGFTVLLGWRLLHESLGKTKLIAVVLSLAGCILVSQAFDRSTWHANLVGIVTGILSGLLYAIYSLMGRAASQRGLNPWTTLVYTFGFAAVFLLIPNLIAGGRLPGSAIRPADLFWLGNELPGWAILFLLAAGPTVAGFGLYNVSLVYLPSGVANLVVTLEPAFTALIAYFAFGEQLNGIQLIGSLIILSAVVLVRISEDQAGRQNERPGGARAAQDTPVKETQGLEIR